MLFAVQYERLGSLMVTGLLKYILYAVLNVLDTYPSLVNLLLKISGDTEREHINDIIVELHIRSIECRYYSVTDLCKLKFRVLPVPFYNLKHIAAPPYPHKFI